jgi:hypothetical protein
LFLSILSPFSFCFTQFGADGATLTLCCAPSSTLFSIKCQVGLSSSSSSLSTKELWLIYQPTQHYQSMRSVVSSFVLKHYPEKVVRSFHQDGTNFILVLDNPITLNININGKDMTLSVAKSWSLSDLIQNLNLSTCLESGPGWEILSLSTKSAVPTNMTELLTTCKQSSLFVSDWDKTIGSVVQDFDRQYLFVIPKVFSFGYFGEGLDYKSGIYTGKRHCIQLVLSTTQEEPIKKEEEKKETDSVTTRIVSPEHAWLHVNMVFLCVFVCFFRPLLRLCFFL